MKLKNKLEVEETLEVGVIPNATTSNFSVVFETAGLFQRRQVGSIINKNDNEYLPSVSNAFPSSVFVVNASTTHANPNLTVSFVNQVAGSVFAAPQSLNGTPAFRMLQDSDLSQTSLSSKQNQLTNGLHTTLNGNKVDVAFDVNTYVKDKSNNDRLLFGNTQPTDVIIKGAVANGDFKVKDSTDADMFRMNGNNKVPYFPQLPAPQTGASNNLAIFDSGNGLWKSNLTIGDLALASSLANYVNLTTAQIIGGQKTFTASTTRWLMANNPLNAYGFVQSAGSGFYTGTLSDHNYEIYRNTVRKVTVTANSVVFVDNISALGFVKQGQNDTQILLAGGGHRPVSDFALASSIITPNNGLLTITTSADLTGGGTFSADQATASNVNIGLSAGTLTDIALGVTANNWGNHAGLYPLLSGAYANPTWITSLDWTKITNKPNIPPQLVYTGSNGINVTGTVISPTYGTTAGTIAEGNDVRINNGQTAFNSLVNYLPLAGGTMTGIINFAATNTQVIRWGNVDKLNISATVTVLAANATTNSTTNGVIFRPSGASSATNQVLISGDGFIRTSLHGNSSQWKQAFDWGNHALAGYALNSQLSGYVPTSRTLTINGTTFDLSADRNWTIPDNDTITRLRGTTSGTYTSGDLTLINGAGIGVSQSGANFTITNSSPNVQADWNATSGLAQILNKPTIPSQLVYTGSNGINVTGTVISPTYGTTANTIAQGNDTRFHNAVTLGTANGLGLAGQVLSLGLASASANGALSSTDWNTFNSKVSANNGTFTVQGTGSLTGTGSTSANATANTTATLDLTQATKDYIQEGVNANTIIPSIVDGVDFTNIPSNSNYNIPIEKKKTIINVSNGVLLAVLNVDDGLYDGYELAINGCSEWLVELKGNIQDKCQNQGSVFHDSSVLYWWSEEMGMWVQAI